MPGVVGVPDNVSVVAFGDVRASPGGKVPVDVKVKEPEAPLAVMFCEYDVPTVAPGSPGVGDAGESVIAEQFAIVRVYLGLPRSDGKTRSPRS